jgi:hypothetical protein
MLYHDLCNEQFRLVREVRQVQARHNYDHVLNIVHVRAAFRTPGHENRSRVSFTHDVRSPRLETKLYTHAQTALE